MPATPAFNAKDIVITLPDGTSKNIKMLEDVSGQLFLPAAQKDLPFKIENSGVREVHIATALSDVNGEEGKLAYRGYKIEDLVEKTSFEEVSYLLLMGDLPNQQQLAKFKQDLAEKATLDIELQQELVGVMKSVKITEKTDPMALLSTLVSVMEAHEKLPLNNEEARYQSTLRTLAVMPTLIGLVNKRLQARDVPEVMDAYSFPYKNDFGPNGQDFSYARLLMASLQNQDYATINDQRVAALDKYLILHAEHGNNLSSFTARVVDSGESKEGSWRITLGAMQSLAGNRHGNASNDALNNLKQILARTDGSTIEEKVDAYIKDSDAAYAKSKAGTPLAAGESFTIEGIGHKIYQAKDPRASALQGILRNSGLQDSDLLKVALTLEDKLKTHPRFGGKASKPLFPNVDFCSGVLLTQYLGLDERLMTCMFAVGRNVGWQAHAAEHARDARNIVRPEAIPLTPPRDFVPMDQRTPTNDVDAAQGHAAFPGANKFAAIAA